MSSDKTLCSKENKFTAVRNHQWKCEGWGRDHSYGITIESALFFCFIYIYYLLHSVSYDW